MIAEVALCENVTHAYCEAMAGERSELDTLTVERFASCGGPCTDLEGAGAQLRMLLVLSVAVTAGGWTTAAACLGTHLHRFHLCLPRWQWLFTRSYTVFVALQLTTSAVLVSSFMALDGVSAALAGLLAADCFDLEQAFVIEESELRLGSAFALTAVNCGVTGLALLLTALTINLPKGSSNQVVPEDKYAIRDRSDGSRLGSPTESERSFKDRGPEAIQDKLSGGGSRKDRAGATTFADLDAFASMGRARRAGRTLMAGPQRRALDRIDMSPDPRGTVPPSPSGVNTQLKR